MWALNLMKKYKYFGEKKYLSKENQAKVLYYWAFYFLPGKTQKQTT